LQFSDNEKLIARCGWIGCQGEEVRIGEGFLRGALSLPVLEGRDPRPLIHETLHQLQRESRLRLTRTRLTVLYKGDDFERLTAAADELARRVRVDLYAVLIGFTGEQRALITERRALSLLELAERLTKGSTKAELMQVLKTAFLDEVVQCIDDPTPTLARDVDDAVTHFYTQFMRLRAAAASPYAAKRPETGDVRWEKKAPGLRHGVLEGQYRFGPLRANFLEVSPKKWRMRVVDAHDWPAEKRNLLTIAESHGAAFATSGGFLLEAEHEGVPTARLGDPLGLLVSDGEVLWPPTIRRTALLSDEDGKLDIWRVGLAGMRLEIGRATVAARKMNPERLQPGEIGLYTSALVGPAPAAPLSITIIGHKVTAVTADEPVEVPTGGLVVCVNPGPIDLGPLALIEPGDLVQYRLPPMRGLGKIDAALAGGPALLTDAQRDGDLLADNFGPGMPPLALSPRTRLAASVTARVGWGLTADYRLIGVCVDGNTAASSVGVTLDELARLLRSVGCVQAVNFAGDTRARMLVDGKHVDRNHSSDLLPPDQHEWAYMLSSAILITER
jgi:Phosphodiester glycosidase